MIPKYLKPMKEYDLIRLGKDNDGGYLVEKDSISKAEALITLGLGYDWSFEKDFISINFTQVSGFVSQWILSLIKLYAQMGKII